jgi:hypothetical protein
MKKFAFLCFFAAATLGTNAQQKIKDGTGTPVASLPAAGSLLELQSTQAGLRFPQVSLTDTKVWAPMLGSGAAATSPGMTVYNTNSGITNASGDANYPALGKGEYYWDGTGWVTKNAAAIKTDFLQTQTAALYVITPTNSTNFTFAAGSTTSAGGTISVTTNTVTLQPGHIYRLTYNIGDIGSATNSFFTYQFFNVGTGSFVGSGAFAESLNGQTNLGSPCEALISPSVVTTLVVRCTTVGAVPSTAIGGYVRSNLAVTTLP